MKIQKIQHLVHIYWDQCAMEIFVLPTFNEPSLDITSS